MSGYIAINYVHFERQHPMCDRNSEFGTCFNPFRRKNYPMVMFEALRKLRIVVSTRWVLLGALVSVINLTETEQSEPIIAVA